MDIIKWHKYSEEQPPKKSCEYLCKVKYNFVFKYEIVLWCEEDGIWGWSIGEQNIVAWTEIPKCDLE